MSTKTRNHTNTQTHTHANKNSLFYNTNTKFCKYLYKYHECMCVFACACVCLSENIEFFGKISNCRCSLSPLHRAFKIIKNVCTMCGKNATVKHEIK